MELLLRNPRQTHSRASVFWSKIWGYDSDVELIGSVGLHLLPAQKADRPSGRYSDQGHPECSDIRWRKSHDPEAAQKIHCRLHAGTDAGAAGHSGRHQHHELLPDRVRCRRDPHYSCPKRRSFSRPDGTASNTPNGAPPDKGSGKERQLSPETPYESRFFSVSLNDSGAVIASDTGSIAAIDASSAENAAVSVWLRGSTEGFWNDYRYVRCKTDSGSRIIFLDTGRSLNAFRSTLLVSIGIALGGLLAVFLLLLLFSRRIVRPVAESYEKQKRFITDAGHEIKTPLTIIGADTDLLELDLGENEWLDDIKRSGQSG